MVSAHSDESELEATEREMRMAEASLISLLHDRATRTPDVTAYTFIDYDVDPSGFAEEMTWAQVFSAAASVADELRTCGSPGDRAAIVAPQGLGYIVSFFGAIQAGFIAVPLSVPMLGVHDERVSSVLRDCAPSVILTTAPRSTPSRPTPRATDAVRHPSSSTSTCWIWIRREVRPAGAAIPKPPTCSTRRVRPACLPGW